MVDLFLDYEEAWPGVDCDGPHSRKRLGSLLSLSEDLPVITSTVAETGEGKEMEMES